MAIYIVVFCVSTALFKLADSVKKEQRVYIDMIGILILCLLAGFRAETIGTDTALYIQPMIKGAISSESIKDFYQYRWMYGFAKRATVDYEIGYSIVVYLVSVIFKSIVVTQTVLELLIILPVYYSLRINNEVPIWSGMLVFELLFFNGSMNANRQAIAMSFVLLGVTCWMAGSKKKGIIFLIVSALFHTSGLLGVIIVCLYEYVGRDRNIEIKTHNKTVNINYINLFIAIIAGIFALVGVQIIISILMQFGLSKYIGYIFGNLTFMPNQLIRILPPFILLLLSVRHFNNVQKYWTFYVVMLTYAMIAGQFTSVNNYGGRMGMYFEIFAVFSYPLACKYSTHKIISSGIMGAYLAFYWWFYFALFSSGETVPYIMIK